MSGVPVASSIGTLRDPEGLRARLRQTDESLCHDLETMETVSIGGVKVPRK